MISSAFLTSADDLISRDGAEADKDVAVVAVVAVELVALLRSLRRCCPRCCLTVLRLVRAILLAV
jgi:hypothetical protein